MPTGVYKRSADQIRNMLANFKKGREPKARVKATKALRKIASDPNWRQMVSDATKLAMHRPEVRIKHLEGLDGARKKHGANFKYGNGQAAGGVVAQFTPALTAQGYIQEFPILTKGHGTGLKCPHAYKVDFGNPETKQAIEFDGPCHRPLARQALDLKKDTVLKAIGWKITRIKHD